MDTHIKNNPVIDLSMKLLKCEGSYEELFKKSISDQLVQSVTERHIEETIDFTEFVKDRDPKSALIISSVNMGFASIIEIGRNIRAKMNACHGLLLMDEDQKYSLKFLLTARELYLKEGMDKHVAGCEVNISILCRNIGNYDKAFDSLHSAINIFKKYGMKGEIARCYMQMGIICWKLDRYGDALYLINTSKTAFKSLGSEEAFASCLINEANILDEIGKNRAALKNYVLAKRVFKRKMKEKDVAKCDLNIAIQFLILGNHQKALILLESLKTFFQKASMIDSLAKCNMNIAIANHNLNNFANSMKYYKISLDFFKKFGWTQSVIECELNMANTYGALGDYDNALFLYNKVEKNNPHPGLKWKSLYGAGEIYEKKGDHEKALPLYIKSIDSIEQIYNRVDQLDHRIKFWGSVYDVYYKTIRCCLELGDYKTALELIERQKNKTLNELLQNKSEYMREEESDFNINTKMNYSKIKALATEYKVVLIELYPMEKNTIIFIIRPDIQEDVCTITINYSYHNLSDDIQVLFKRYHKFINETNHQKRTEARIDWEKYLEKILSFLYEELFSKLKDYIDTDDRIVFIPYSLYHFIPLHAMFSDSYDGNRKYIIEDYIISYSPSAKLLQNCLQRKRKNKKKMILAGANPKNFLNLFYAHSELDSIKCMFEGPDPIYQACKADIINLDHETHFFHYAGHSQFDSLVLHKNDGSNSEEKLNLYDILMNVYLPKTYLVTLSSCETGLNDPGMVDECIGLTSAFLYSGSATVISSLWSISDVSTTLLMNKMYTNIKKGMTKVEALRDAQLWLKQRENNKEHLDILSDIDNIHWSDTNLPTPKIPDFSSIFYWAGFICSGDNLD